MVDSHFQSIIEKLKACIAEENTTPSQLAKIITMAVEIKESLEGTGTLPENKEWVDKTIKDFLEIIVRANYKAHTILNPWLEMPPVEEQVAEALKKV